VIEILRLTPQLRKRLKTPLGVLIKGSFEETMKELKKMIEKEKPPKIIAVGDVVSSNLMKYGVYPQVFIIDNRVMRESITPIQVNADETILVKNPAGTLTEEAIEGVQRALNREHRIKVMVDGEEDLLTLAAVAHAPENSLVVYGQPHEGVVAVIITKEKRDEVRKIIEAMVSVA